MNKSDRRVFHLSPEAEAALAFANNETGADRMVLEQVAEATVGGWAVSADFQKIANAVLANALLEGKLPRRAAGRPFDEQAELKHVECAYRYFELLDSGTLRVAEKLAAQMHVEKRQVERYAKNYKWLVGRFPEDRDRLRAWRAGVTEDEHKSDVLMQLRLRASRSVAGGLAGNDSRLKAAPALVTRLRQDLLEISVPPLIRPTGEVEGDRR